MTIIAGRIRILGGNRLHPSVTTALFSESGSSATDHLRTVGKLLFGSSNQESMIELPQGQLYLVRPLSPKGYSELIFKDASAKLINVAGISSPPAASNAAASQRERTVPTSCA